MNDGDIDEVRALTGRCKSDSEVLLCKSVEALLLLKNNQASDALRVFGDVYFQAKHIDGHIAHRIKLFSLYYIALGNGAFPDAAYHARKARQIRVPAMIKLLLPIPVLPERHIPGPVAVASL